jgi:hypothetical protein
MTFWGDSRISFAWNPLTLFVSFTSTFTPVWVVQLLCRGEYSVSNKAEQNERLETPSIANAFIVEVEEKEFGADQIFCEMSCLDLGRRSYIFARFHIVDSRMGVTHCHIETASGII